MKYAILFTIILLFLFELQKSQLLFLDSLSQYFASNLTHAVADDAELQRWMALCAADTRCSRFSGMSIGGSYSIDTFTQMLTLVPFTQNPPMFNNGIYDVLVGNADLAAVNDELIILRMVYAFSYYASSCAAIEIPVLIDGVMTCQQNPRIIFIDPNYYNWFIMVAIGLTIVLLFCILVVIIYAVKLERDAIRATQPQYFSK